MTGDTFAKGLFESTSAYIKLDKTKYEVKSSVVFDDKEPLNVAKMYIVIHVRDPKAKAKNDKGEWVKDESWRFIFKTKKGCLTFRTFTEFRMVKWYKGETYKKSLIFWREDTTESRRLRAFVGQFRSCTDIMDSVSKCFEIATARYYETKKHLSITDEVTN